MSDKNTVKKQLQELYKSVIGGKLGVIVNIDKDGDINFKYGTLGVLLLPCDADAPNYFRLIDQVEVGEWSEQSESVALKVVNKVNMQVKCITQSVRKIEQGGSERLILMNAVEAFIAGEGDLPAKEFLEASFEDYAGVLDAGRNLFVQEYTKVNGNS